MHNHVGDHMIFILNSHLRYFNLAALILLGLPVNFYAQSGRRLPSKTQTTPTQTAPAPEDQKSQDKQEEKKKIEITLCADTRLQVMDNGRYTEDVLRSCTERLSQSTSLKLTVGGEKNRKGAYEGAKALKAGYLVWLEVGSEGRPGTYGTGSNRNMDSFYVDYVIFEAGSGKTLDTGRVYATAQVGNVGVGLPIPGSTPNSGNIYYYMQEAGKKTADRVMSYLNIPPPPR